VRFRTTARHGSMVGLVLLSFVGVALSATPASAAQQQDANIYAYWNYPTSSSLTNVDQEVRFTKKSRYTFLAQLWSWTDVTYGGYVGLQTDGVRFNGTTGDTAIYSLWNANGAAAASGASCGQFDGEGNGWSCRRALSIKTTDFYRLRVTRGSADSLGQWWTADVYDLATKTDYPLGKIRVGLSHKLMHGPANFSEYFGPAVPTCADVPVSIADWTRPAGNRSSSGTYGVYGSFSVSDRGACTGGSVVKRTNDGQPGVRVTQGGPL
jgi:hypothetical protein